MSFTADIYRALNDAINRDTSGILKTEAMRMVHYDNGNDVAFSVNRETRQKSIYIAVGEDCTKASFPKWNGVSIALSKLPDYDANATFVALCQLQDSEDYIFEIVAEDLRKSIECSSNGDAYTTLVTILAKWKAFFQYDGEVVMSDIKQQGLMGELLFLEKCIKTMGVSAVAKWSGWNSETHDFYFGNNAVEVKTTSRKDPYSVHISSERQMDNNDVDGSLFLEFFAFRKSHNSGVTLPEKVNEIRELLVSSDVMKKNFNEYLKKYGYINEVADLYGTGYYTRDNYHYEVSDGFPCITKPNIQSGVHNVEYSISLSECKPFILEYSDLMQKLCGGVDNAK